jgi:hypothetical protein
MKSEIIQNENSITAKYPCLRQHIQEDGSLIIVLFTNLITGTVVHSEGGNPGQFYDNWNPLDFTSFTGKIVLQND